MTTHSRPTQSSQILSHLMVHGSITPLEALEKYRCMRLAPRIFELKAQGHAIACDKSAGFARYSLTHPVQLALL